MSHKEFAEGSVIIKEGDEGKEFFVVDSGSTNIYVNKYKSEDNPEGFAVLVESGGMFGELALMVNHINQKNISFFLSLFFFLIFFFNIRIT